MRGGNGDDRLEAHGGDDTLNGGFGVDKLYGDLLGGDGDDRLNGSAGVDAVCDGGPGVNTIVNCP